MKQYVQQINFKNGTTVFTRQELLDIPDFERTQIDRTKDEHLKRGGIFTSFKNAKGNKVRGKFVLKKNLDYPNLTKNLTIYLKFKYQPWFDFAEYYWNQTHIFVMLCSFNNSLT